MSGPSRVADALADARRKYRNWGRWGPDDALGTLNYIDDAKRAAAAALARTGRAFSLAVELTGAVPGGGHRGGSLVHTMLDSAAEGAPFSHGFGDADDVVFMPLRSGTHWDGLGHVFDNALAWNGRHRAMVVTASGDRVTGAERQAAGFVSRGVLLDVGRVVGGSASGGSASGGGSLYGGGSPYDGGSPYGGGGSLPDGHAITEDQLLATIRAQGPSAQVTRGDIVLVRTGQLARCRGAGDWAGYASGPAPGLSFASLAWLHGTEIAAIATDTSTVEVRPHEFDTPCVCPLHQIAIPNIGLFLGEMFDLEALAADCAADGVYEFLLVAAGLPIAGGLGLPVNPIAVK